MSLKELAALTMQNEATVTDVFAHLREAARLESAEGADHSSMVAEDGDFRSRVPLKYYFKAPKEKMVWLTKDGKQPMAVLQRLVEEEDSGIMRGNYQGDDKAPPPAPVDTSAKPPPTASSAIKIRSKLIPSASTLQQWRSAQYESTSTLQQFRNTQWRSAQHQSRAK